MLGLAALRFSSSRAQRVHRRRLLPAPLIRNSFLTVDIDPVVFGEFVVRQDLPATLPPFPFPAPGTGQFCRASTLHYDETSNSTPASGNRTGTSAALDAHDRHAAAERDKAADWKRVFESPTHVTFSHS